MFDSILIVCTGNVCRSPVGERWLRRALPDKKIDSAGIAALVGRPADDGAIRVAQRHGLSLDGHQARQFTVSLSNLYSLILVMEKSQIEHLSRIAPQARGKAMLMGHWLDKREIPDPYGKSDDAFNHVYQLIDQACRQWVSKLGG